MSSDESEDEVEPPVDQVTDTGFVIPVPAKDDVLGDLGKIAGSRKLDLTTNGRVERIEAIRDWLKAHADDRDACAAMRAWATAVMSGGKQLASGGFERVDEEGHPTLYFAFVPGTGAIATFYERNTVPVRQIVFVSVIDAP